MKYLMHAILIISVSLFIQCGKSDKSGELTKTVKTETRYISANGGLKLRDKPDTKGKVLGIIPDGAKVVLLEETGKAMTISGATGKWSNVKWVDETGWVFGGFLSEKEKTVKQGIDGIYKRKNGVQYIFVKDGVIIREHNNDINYDIKGFKDAGGRYEMELSCVDCADTDRKIKLSIRPEGNSLKVTESVKGFKPEEYILQED